MTSATMTVQFLGIIKWLSTVTMVLSVKVVMAGRAVELVVHRVWLANSMGAGKWAMGTMARILRYVVLGGQHCGLNDRWP